MKSDDDQISRLMYTVSFILLGLGILFLIAAETIGGKRSLQNVGNNMDENNSLSDEYDDTCEGLRTTIIIGIFIVLSSPIAIGIFASAPINEQTASTLGQLLFGSAQYAPAIYPYSYGSSIGIALIFGLAWSGRKAITGNSERKILLRITFGMILSVGAVVTTAVLIFRVGFPDPTMKELIRFDRAGILPGQLYRTVLTLAYSSLVVLALESYFDDQFAGD